MTPPVSAPRAVADDRDRVVELLGRLLARHWLRRRPAPGPRGGSAAGPPGPAARLPPPPERSTRT